MKKRYADGGVIGNANYPFGQGQTNSVASSDTGLGNSAPLVQVNNPPPAPQPLSDTEPTGMRKGGKVKAKKYAAGGKVSSASKRADGCATKGKTKGRMV